MRNGDRSSHFTRRDFARGAGLAGAGLSLAVGAHAASADEAVSSGAFLNAKSFGAAGDGKSDDTKAIQAALDKAGEIQGAVFVPPGVYMCSTLIMHPLSALVAVPSWGYGRLGGAIIRLADGTAKCLIDITAAYGCTLDGLCLDGQGLGEDIAGVLLDKKDYGGHEDAFRIERCLISSFTGDGVRLNCVWCYSIRHSMICFNKKSGVSHRGWDAFLLDNWLSGNSGAGFYAHHQDDSAVTIVGNRIEWNKAGGIVLYGAYNYNVNDNYIDRCGGPGISLANEGRGHNGAMSITGNHINRSGKWAKPDTYESCHIRIDDARGVAIVGNSFLAGRDDRGQGEYSPSFGIVYSKLSHCVIKDNVLYQGATKELLVNLGDPGEDVIVKDNPGTLFKPKTP